MALSKNIDLSRDFAAGVFYLSEALLSYDPILLPPPLSRCIRVYSILIHTGKGGRGES